MVGVEVESFVDNPVGTLGFTCRVKILNKKGRGLQVLHSLCL